MARQTAGRGVSNARTVAFGAFAGTALEWYDYYIYGTAAALFGHWGDKYGRRRMLLVTVVTIGVVTGVIGLLPTYETIGVAAPILVVVMRILQGISVGGEWSGAATLAIEQAERTPVAGPLGRLALGPRFRRSV